MSDNVSLTEVSGKNRYQIHLNGDLAGFIGYQDTDIAGTQQRVINRTRVFEEFGGRGLAGILTKHAVEDAAAVGKNVVPLCPYVERWAQKHPEYADIVDPITEEHRERFAYRKSPD